jgi:translation initiation factor IF-2
MSKGSVVAGCKILKGKVTRGAMARVLRGGSIVHEGRIESLRHEKEDIKAAETGLECGILLSGFKGFETGDIIEAFQVEMMERKL